MNQDDEIKELQQEHKRFAALEAQLKLIGRVLMGLLATGTGVVGTLLVKWNDIEISLSDIKGELQGHKAESARVVEQMQGDLDECHDDLERILRKPEYNGKSKR